MFLNNHNLPDLPNITVFDTKQAILLFYEHMENFVYWLQRTYFTFPTRFGESASTWYISYWDLFFSAWAVLLIVSWIPEIGPTVAAAADENDEDSDDYVFF